MIRVKNHQTPATILVDTARGAISQPENNYEIIGVNSSEFLYRTDKQSLK